MKRLLFSVLRAIYPRRCAYCDRVIDPDVMHCEYCAPDIPYMDDPVCKYCGVTKSLCTCQKHRRHFERCVAAMRYEDGAANAVRILKHDDNADRVETMAYEMTAALRAHTDAAAFDAVTCVPMHRKDFRRREYNQSELLAKEVASILGIPFRKTLKKIYDTRSQKTLHRVERSGNLLGVFDVIENVKDERILLVDDVSTTGATLHECSKMLKIAGASSVTALVFAVTVYDKTQSQEE